MTIFKCDETMKRYYAGRATLLETMHRKDLWSTQMKNHIWKMEQNILLNTQLVIITLYAKVTGKKLLTLVF